MARTLFQIQSVDINHDISRIPRQQNKCLQVENKDIFKVVRFKNQMKIVSQRE